MDVIVLGGGLMGTASAFFLAQRGARVTLIERNRIGTGATVASFGNIRRTGRYLPQLPLAHRARALWGQAETLLGRDVEFRATGHLRLIFDDDSLSDMRRFAEAAQHWGFDLQELSQAQLRQRFPGLGTGAIAASFAPQDGSANPRLISPAFAEAAANQGVRIIEQTNIGAITHTAGSFSVETGAGTVQAEALLNCAGAWGGQIAAQFGETVPITAHGPQMGVTEPLPHRVLPVVGIWTQDPTRNAYLRQVERGNIVFGGGTPRRPVTLDPGHGQTDPTGTPDQMRALVRLLPALRDVAVIRTWSGCEGYVQDMLPVIGPSATTPGLFHAFGFCGHGFQLGPGVGDAMAELITAGQCTTPLDDFRINRFAA